MVAAVFIAAACSDDGGNVRVPPAIEDQDGTPPASEVDDSRDNYIDEAKEQLQALEDRLAELKEDAENETDIDARAELEERVDELEAQVDSIGDKIEDAELGDSDTLDDIRAEIEAAFDDIRSRIQDLEDELGI
jgi:hypothetical protein